VDLEEIEFMVNSVSKNPGTKIYYKYLLSIFKERFISGDKSLSKNIILDSFAKEIDVIYSDLSKGVKSYLNYDLEIEGIYRDFSFMRSGLKSTSN
jgi:hypothetical protein